MIRKAIYSEADVYALSESGADWSFSKERTNENLHSIHPYPAKFIPQIPRRAIEMWAPTKGLILDPFAGVGTTLLEAQLSGRKSIGIDTNPVAELVSKTKTYPYSDQDLVTLKSLVVNLESILRRAKLRPDLIPEDERFLSWFDTDVVATIYKIKGIALDQEEPIRSFFLTALSAIIVRVSKQDSDTRYSRVEKKFRNPEEIDKIFFIRFRQSVASLAEIHPKPIINSNFILGDARQRGTVKANSIDLIITSPPYLNAYDYHKYHRQRIHVIDGNPTLARQTEIGGHDKFTRPNANPDQFFSDLEACLVEWKRSLKPDARAFILIGDAIVHGKSVMVADEMIRIAEAMNFTLDWRAIRPVASTRKSFGAGARMNFEHMILLKK